MPAPSITTAEGEENSRHTSITRVERVTCCIIAYDVGYDREPPRLQALLSTAPSASQYYSDQLAACTNLAYYPDQHEALPNKRQTYSDEGAKSECRHYLARLVLCSRCLTRSLQAICDALKLFLSA